MKNDKKWTNLGLDEADIDLLSRYKTPGLSPVQSARLEEELMTRITEMPIRDPWAGLRVAWLQVRLKPVTYLGGTLALWLVGTIVSLGWHRLSSGAPMLVWAILAPWMAIGAWLGPSGWRTGALKEFSQAAPLRPWQIRSWQASGIAMLNVILVLIVVVVGFGNAWVKVLVEWWIPFAMAGGGVLWLSTRRMKPFTATALTILLAAANMVLVVGLVAWLPGWQQAATSVPVTMWTLSVLSVLALLGGILVRARAV